MKPLIAKVGHRTWNVVNFEEVAVHDLCGALSANDWCVQQNTKEWLADWTQSVTDNESLYAVPDVMKSP